MKKMIALALALVLALGVMSTALAKTDYESSFIKGLGWTSSQMVSTSSMRVDAVCAALLGYAFVHPNGSDTWDGLTGLTAKIADWGSCVDIYIPYSDGRWLNLFVAPTTGKISDYGVGTTGPVTTSYTYYDVSMLTVWNRIVEILNSVSGS